MADTTVDKIPTVVTSSVDLKLNQSDLAELMHSELLDNKRTQIKNMANTMYSYATSLNIRALVVYNRIVETLRGQVSMSKFNLSAPGPNGYISSRYTPTKMEFNPGLKKPVVTSNLGWTEKSRTPGFRVDIAKEGITVTCNKKYVRKPSNTLPGITQWQGSGVDVPTFMDVVEEPRVYKKDMQEAFDGTHVSGIKIEFKIDGPMGYTSKDNNIGIIVNESQRDIMEQMFTEDVRHDLNEFMEEYLNMVLPLSDMIREFDKLKKSQGKLKTLMLKEVLSKSDEGRNLLDMLKNFKGKKDILRLMNS